MVGVDVGGTKILVGLVSDAGEVLRAERYPIDRSSQATSMASIESAVTRFLDAPWDGPAPLAMGMGVVGQTSPATATWVRAMNIPISQSIDVQAWLGDRCALPVALDNDVHAATLAELRWGAGPRISSISMWAQGWRPAWCATGSWCAARPTTRVSWDTWPWRGMISSALAGGVAAWSRSLPAAA